MKNVLIIYNPESGQKNSPNVAQELNDILTSHYVNTTLYKIDGVEDLEQVIIKAIAEDVDTFAVLGGDGTISRVVNIIAPYERRPDILLLPVGTTNNLARALDIELNAKNLLKSITNQNFTKKTIDVGKINDHYFISTASVGSLPEVALNTDDQLKERFGPLGYVIEGLDVLKEQKSFDLIMRTDTEEYKIEDVFLLLIGLTNSIFGIPTFFKEAEYDDGYLHLYILRKADVLSEIRTLAEDIKPGETNTNQSTLSTMSRFKKASIETKESLQFVLDGEEGPSFPVEMEILKQHLNFILPEK